MPKVSIIVPVYNLEKLVVRCLESIQAQTFTDWECLVVNDGSTDGNKYTDLQFFTELHNSDFYFTLLTTFPSTLTTKEPGKIPETAS